jgi:hypothetical protein
VAVIEAKSPADSVAAMPVVVVPMTGTKSLGLFAAGLNLFHV